MKTFKSGEYNTTVWRVQDGKAFSVSVVEMVDGKILRHNAHGCSGLEGSTKFHDYFLSYHGSFAGKPTELFTTPGTDAFKNAIRGGIDKTFKKTTSTSLR